VEVSSDRLYSVPAGEVDYDLVRQFALDAEAADLFTGSLTFEAKEKEKRHECRGCHNALGNTDGGIVRKHPPRQPGRRRPRLLPRDQGSR
jgi:hypothetical protein